MEEELLSAIVADEPEPFVVNHPFNPSLRHNALLSSPSSLSGPAATVCNHCARLRNAEVDSVGSELGCGWN
jgi:hypothetical protein